MITLLLLGPAREAAGVRQDQFDALTLKDLLECAVQRYGMDFERVLANSQIWINGDQAPDDSLLGPYDEVAVLPPISGG